MRRGQRWGGSGEEGDSGEQGSSGWSLLRPSGTQALSRTGTSVSTSM